MKQTNRIGHRAKLLVAFAMFVVTLAFANGSVTAAGPHGPYSATTDDCATCHRVHTGQGSAIVKASAPQSNLCFTCHDGAGASADVRTQYTDPAVPANNPATRDYYSHYALVATNHTLSKANEFGGLVNRHSECGDCHNAHSANDANGVELPTGWTVSGRLTGNSGVEVTNGPANTEPTYTFKNGVDSQIGREYELCLKCHSGFTQLSSNMGFPLSKYVLDKGVEFNPNNPSYHPVEAPGKNLTGKMAASLAGASPYKQWNFTTASTIRCTNCHASSSRYSQPTPPTAGGDLPPHTSQYRGILLQNYRDRLLKSSSEPYSGGDFALCLMCHAAAPFASETSTATNFPPHGMHLTRIAGIGSGGTDIDTSGAGQGNAICAECHYRLHSTTYAAGGQTINGSRLVNFAPNVQPFGGLLFWGGNSCTLTCHGKSHDDAGY